MKWRDATVDSDQSILSLDIEQGAYSFNDSRSSTICISDLTAPNTCCRCIHLQCFRRKPSVFVKVLRSSKRLTNSSNHAGACETINSKTEIDGSIHAEGHYQMSSPDQTAIAEDAVPMKESASTLNNASNPDQKSIPFRCCRDVAKLNKLKHIVCNIVYSLLSSIMLMFGLSAIIEFGARTYVRNVSENSTKINDVVNAPSFVTLMSTAGTILIYPIYLTVRACMSLRTGMTKELFVNHHLILAGEQPALVKVLTRCTLLSVFWQIFVNCTLRSLKRVSPVDCAVILSVFPCFYYLLCWIIVQRRFSSLRVIAFIMASSGVILNIYSDQQFMWFKCLTSFGLVSYSLYTVILKRIINRPTFGQFAAFYFVFGIFNTITFWPIFVFTSILTDAEPIQWSSVQWPSIIGIGGSLIAFLLATQLSNRRVVRAIRMLQPLGSPIILLVYHEFWKDHSKTLNNVRIGSFVLIAIACLLNALPNKWIKALNKTLLKFRATRSPQQITKRGKVSSAASTVGSANTAGQISNARLSVLSSNPNSRPGSGNASQTSEVKSKTRNRFSSVLLRSPPLGNQN